MFSSIIDYGDHTVVDAASRGSQLLLSFSRQVQRIACCSSCSVLRAVVLRAVILGITGDSSIPSDIASSRVACIGWLRRGPPPSDSQRN